MNELYIMKICKYPKIIKLYDIYEMNNNIYIVMEYFKNDNLFYFLTIIIVINYKKILQKKLYINYY